MAVALVGAGVHLAVAFFQTFRQDQRLRAEAALRYQGDAARQILSKSLDSLAEMRAAISAAKRAMEPWHAFADRVVGRNFADVAPDRQPVFREMQLRMQRAKDDMAGVVSEIDKASLLVSPELHSETESVVDCVRRAFQSMRFSPLEGDDAPVDWEAEATHLDKAEEAWMRALVKWKEDHALPAGEH